MTGVSVMVRCELNLQRDIELEMKARGNRDMEWRRTESCSFVGSISNAKLR